MNDAAVLYEVQGGVAEITLNRAENRNAMTPDLLASLESAVERAKSDAALRCVIVTGRGKSFCAGADFKARREESLEGRFRAPHERSYDTYAPFLSLLDLEVPTIAAMQGHAIGGGLGLAIVCDLRVANAEARYGANFVRLGLSPGMANTYLLPRLMGVPNAVELLLTGRLVDGAEALHRGLVHYAVPEAFVLPKARALAAEIAAAAPLAVRWTKRTFYEGLVWDPRTAARREAAVQSRSFETDDFREGVAALLGKREPEFKGR
ncbi:MAG: enoyl-CoA hydratase/isomerase family protein [Myxococcota bacterium]